MKLIEIELVLGCVCVVLLFYSCSLFSYSSKELLMLFLIEICSSMAVIFSHTECAANLF